MGKPIRAQEMTWSDVAAYLNRRKTALIPVGALEQHGSHLPMGTDTILATRVAEDASAECGVIVYPPLWYGWSDYHMAFTGTVTLRPGTLSAIAQDVARSLIYHGFKNLIFVNGHRRANVPPLQMALSEVQAETDVVLAVADLGYLAFTTIGEIRRSEPGGIGHAGEMETSQMLHLHGDLVHMDRARKNASKAGRFQKALLPSDPAHEHANRVLVLRGVEAFRRSAGPDGTLGDPTVAHPETGRKLHEAIVANLVAFIDELEPR
jgi:creatinine amidohydrolase